MTLQFLAWLVLFIAAVCDSAYFLLARCIPMGRTRLRQSSFVYGLLAVAFGSYVVYSIYTEPMPSNERLDPFSSLFIVVVYGAQAAGPALLGLLALCFVPGTLSRNR
jgi:hypothetical protein